MSVKRYCIIVAGGSGKRMMSAIPKQFLLLDGKPLLMHTIERFHSFDPLIEIIVVLPSEHHSLWSSLVEEYSFGISHSVAAGGEERFHSVRAGLELVKAAMLETGRSDAGQQDDGRDEDMAPDTRPDSVRDESLLAVHDGVRPLVSHDTIWRCYADAGEFGTAVPFIEPADSVRVLQGDDSKPMQRNVVRLIQTPQVFRASLILKAYERDFDPSFTDDATVAEAAGIKIHLTHGNRENIKITTPEDLAVAHTLARMLKQ
jgi:2-C-methyl-D-erythritol 4-phosphate cytidylyltransferase